MHAPMYVEGPSLSGLTLEPEEATLQKQPASCLLSPRWEADFRFSGVLNLTLTKQAFRHSVQRLQSR